MVDRRPPATPVPGPGRPVPPPALAERILAAALAERILAAALAAFLVAALLATIAAGIGIIVSAGQRAPLRTVPIEATVEVGDLERLEARLARATAIVRLWEARAEQARMLAPRGYEALARQTNEAQTARLIAQRGSHVGTER